VLQPPQLVPHDRPSILAAAHRIVVTAEAIEHCGPAEHDAMEHAFFEVGHSASLKLLSQQELASLIRAAGRLVRDHMHTHAAGGSAWEHPAIPSFVAALVHHWSVSVWE
jgi:hypothetical protein